MSLYKPHAPITQRTGFLERVRGHDTYNPLFYVRISEAGHTDSMLVPAQAQVEGFFPNWVRVAAAAVHAGNLGIRVAVERNNGSWWITRVLADDETVYDAAGVPVPPPAAIDVGNQHEVATNESVREWSAVGGIESLLEVSDSEAVISYTDTDQDVFTRLHIDPSGIELTDGRTELVSDRDNRRFIVQREGFPRGALRPVVVTNADPIPQTVEVRDRNDQFVGTWSTVDLFRAARALFIDESGVSGGGTAPAPGAITPPTDIAVRIFPDIVRTAVTRTRTYRKRVDWMAASLPSGRTLTQYRAIEFDQVWEGATLLNAMPGADFDDEFDVTDNRYDLSGNQGLFYLTGATDTRFRSLDEIVSLASPAEIGFAMDALFTSVPAPSPGSIPLAQGAGAQYGLVAQTPYQSYGGATIVRMFGATGLGALGNAVVNDLLCYGIVDARLMLGVVPPIAAGRVDVQFGNASLRAAGWEFVQALYRGQNVVGVSPLPALRAEHIELIHGRGWTVRSEFRGGSVSAWALPQYLIRVKLRPGFFLQRV